jgi:hypothetical protein
MEIRAAVLVRADFLYEPDQGGIEVGVTTAEAYRGQGLAAIACARLIEMCEAKGEPEYRYVSWARKKLALRSHSLHKS